MTKVTILGEKPKEKKLIPIKAIGCIQNGNQGAINYREYDLNGKEEVKVIRVNGYSQFDCIIIDDRNNVYIGYFNDGVL